MSFQFREKNNNSFKRNRGFFGIAIFNPKHESNVGVLWRSASIFGASFIATVGERRYKSMKSDTMQSHRHIPLFHFNDIKDLKNHLPKECSLVGIELTNEAHDLSLFSHPERSLYLLGSEDQGIPYHIIQLLDFIIKINTPMNISLNVGAAGSIVCYDRISKSERK